MYSTLAGEQYHELLVPKSFGPTTRATLSGESAPAPEATPSPLSPQPHPPHIQPEANAVDLIAQGPSRPSTSPALYHRLV